MTTGLSLLNADPGQAGEDVSCRCIHNDSLEIV